MISKDELNSLSEIYLMALAVWREARGEPVPVKWGVACVILNRVKHPGWWGKDITTVITHHYQFSSFNSNDPNSNKFPLLSDSTWQDSLRCARDVYYGIVGDPTHGATMYYDKSLDSNPPKWSEGLTKVELGSMRFFTQEIGVSHEEVNAVATVPNDTQSG